MDNNFQKSIVLIDEEELKSWKQLPATTSNSETLNPNDYLVYTDFEGKQLYFRKNDVVLF